MATIFTLALALAFALASSASAGDKSWNFQNARSKQQAQDQASAQLGSADFSDNGNGQKLKAMFDDWAATYNMNFASNQDKMKAMKNFRDNMKQIRDVNMNPTSTWWASGNQFSHLSHEEFASTYLMAPGATDSSEPQDAWVPPPGGRKLLQISPEVNWAAVGKVGPVRDQGGCGSCWAFAATAAIESMYLIKVGGVASTLHLSEQQLVSCLYTNGCNGGSSASAMNYVFTNNQTTSAIYPYLSGVTSTGGACNKALLGTLRAGQVVKASSYSKLATARSESAFQLAVRSQPIVIYFNATAGWQNYVSGIFDAALDGCAPGINHAMVAVGYSTSSPAGRYWIIRNSWSTGWGEKGYARVRMTGDGPGPCGMYQYGMIPSPAFNSTKLTVL